MRKVLIELDSNFKMFLKNVYHHIYFVAPKIQPYKGTIILLVVWVKLKYPA
jgi:hypothetical protein